MTTPPRRALIWHKAKRRIRFYAPWCGHCQNLKPAYEKAAKNLEGLAKVAAINCDEDDNKPFCGQMGVQGFPTLKVVVPSKKPGKPRVEDYHGARSAKGIVDAVVDKIPNHVKKLTDKDMDGWVSEEADSPKTILFTEKGSTSALIRALAIDFLGSIKVGQVRSKETGTAKKYGVKKFPTLVLLPGGDKEPIVYDGELKKEPIVKFLSKVAAPNPDPAPAKAKSSSKSSKSSKPKASSSQSAKPKADEAEKHETAESQDPKESQPAQASSEKQIATFETEEALKKTCLSPKTGTCLLAFVPGPKESNEELSESAKAAVTALAEIAHRHSLHQSALFPLYSVPATNSGSSAVRTGLGLSDKDGKSIEIIALNARRGWFRRYDASKGFDVQSVEAWIDAVRLGDGPKEKLPEGIIGSAGARDEL